MEIYGTHSCPICGEHPVPLVNTASVTGRYQCGTCGGELSATSQPTVTQVVDVTLDKSVSPTCARAGQTVRYTITLRNRSSLPACRARIWDPDIENKLTVGTIYCNGRPVEDGSLADGILIPGLGAGCSAVLTFEATLPAAVTGEITNTAYADVEFPADVCGVSLEAVASNQVAVRVISPGLTITKSAAPCAVTAEDNVVTYTLTVENTGTCCIRDVVVTDTLPDGLTYVRGSTVVGTCDPVDRDPADGISVGKLAAGDAVEVVFQASAEI
jgi:uncharacterized repeat protein (TIGR01451 family)